MTTWEPRRYRPHSAIADRAEGIIKAHHPEMLIWSWAFATGLYLATLVYLLRYVFQRDVMTADRRWGAAAAYLMIGASILIARLAGVYPPQRRARGPG